MYISHEACTQCDRGRNSLHREVEGPHPAKVGIETEGGEERRRRGGGEKRRGRGREEGREERREGRERRGGREGGREERRNVNKIAIDT